MPTHYERLGVHPEDDRDTIWRAYLSAVRTALSSDEPVSQLRALDEAWEVLQDPDRRAVYDAQLSGTASPAQPPTPIDDGPVDEPPEPTVAEEPPPRELAAPAETETAPAETETAPAHEEPAPVHEEPAPATTEPAPAWPASGRPKPRWGRVAMWLVLGALVGVAAGAGLYLLAERPEPFAEGTCVALEADEALHVSCDDPAADGRITTITDEPQGCEGADGGWIERPDGRIACVELLPEE